MKQLEQKKMRNNENKNEIDDIKYIIYMIYIYICVCVCVCVCVCIYDFQQFKTIKSFGYTIYTGNIKIDEADMDQSNLKVEN